MSGRSLQTWESEEMCPYSNCLPVVQHQLSLGVGGLLEAAMSLAGDARNQFMLIGFFYLFLVLVDILVDNN